MSKGKIYTAVQGQTTYGEAIGIIMMETFMPFPPGSPGNATTFDYPVRYTVVNGATMERVVFDPDPNILPLFVEAGRELVREGVKAITGNCGFMIFYQDQMAQAFDVPVFMSSLLQLPFISRLLKPGEKVGIITANSKTLSAEHLRIATNGAEVPVLVTGMEDQPNFYGAIHAEKGELDFDKVEAEVIHVVRKLVSGDSSVKVILFECTDLPPYAAAVQRAVDLPVFDYTTMINYVHSSLVRKPFTGYQ